HGRSGEPVSGTWMADASLTSGLFCRDLRVLVHGRAADRGAGPRGSIDPPAIADRAGRAASRGLGADSDRHLPYLSRKWRGRSALSVQPTDALARRNPMVCLR